ncbi:zinc finger, CCHC-type containing protein [Tanacetum coccineum]
MNKSCTTWKRPYLKRLLPLQLLLFAMPRPVGREQQVAYLMLVSMSPEIQRNLEDQPIFETLQELKTMFQQQAEQELFETVKAFHACNQEEGQSVSTYVLKMKAYLDHMERLGYPMPLTISELHAMLKLVEKGIPKKTPTVLAIRQGQIQKPKSQARGKGKQRGKGKSKLAYDPKHKIPPPAKKEHPAKDTECHHCYKTGHKATASGTSGYRKLNKGALDLYVGNGHSAAVKAIGSFKLILPSGMILHCRLGHIKKKCIEKLQHDALLESIDDESFDVRVSCISGKMARKPFTYASERANDLLGIIHSNSEDAQPSQNTSLHQHEVEPDIVEPQTDVIPIRRSARISQAPERYGFYIDAEEHELGDHGEPTNYRPALSDPESEKWLEAMNAEMQSMKDNQF